MAKKALHWRAIPLRSIIASEPVVRPEKIMKILKTTASIRRSIVSLMRPGRVRRVAIVAFVGAGARAFIPRPKGVEIICWPKAGGTNPLELRRLKQMGVNVRFADGLHMKLYWAEGRGTVLTSANLTTNALGSGNLKEIGVLLPPDAIDIDELIASLKSRRFNKREMRKLEERHRKINAGQPRQSEKTERVEYLEWLSHSARSEWKLGWWDGFVQIAKEAKEIVRADFNKREPEYFISCRKKDYRQADWVLCFRLTSKGASTPKWMFVDFVVKVGRREKAYCTDNQYQAAQVWTPRHYPTPPFVVTPAFRAALRAATLKIGVERIKSGRSTNPSARLLKMIAQGM